MDYVVGGVAALISGNVTPNRPKLVRRALTPIKHQASPNVTPKSELVDDRSIFLSPSVQKKKAIVKKSPKRIFQNPDLDVTLDGESKSSPKADKVKKHLQGDLEQNNVSSSSKSPKNKQNKALENSVTEEIESPQSANENTPKKKKKKRNSLYDTNITADINDETQRTPKRKKTQETVESISNTEENIELKPVNNENDATEKIIDGNDKVSGSPKKSKNKKKKAKLNNQSEQIKVENESESNKIENKPKKSKKKKNKNSSPGKNEQIISAIETESSDEKNTIKEANKPKKKNKNQTVVNPNAITNQDTDSEHESDDEILSENEEANKEMLKTEPADESSDDEVETDKKVEPKEKPDQVRTEDEIKRTLFVGNVPFSKKCKKEIKKIFSKYGAIETVRIRTVPVKDARVTPKLAVIKNELHAERTTVNVYVKFQDASSVEKALVENNSVIDGCHLRVSRSDATGAEHDPRNAVFVGNMPFALEDEALREKFVKCGEIVSVRIIRDKKTNAGKGFGYVNFASKDGVELALALSEEDLTIKNRILRVKRCTQTNQRQQNQPGKNKSQGMRNRNQGMQGKKFGNKGPKQWGQRQDGVGEGAQRRLMNKRKSQDNSEGPDEKKQKYLNQPQKEKKTRKEFVGMTAEKKKKHTFNKGQKKKRALSEILTK